RENLPMSAGKRKPIQPGKIKPFAGGFRTIARGRKSIQRDAIACNRMLDRADGMQRFRSEAESLSGGCGEIRPHSIEFHIGKLPKMRVDDAGGTLSDEETILMLHQEGGETSLRGNGPLAEIG